MRPGEIVGGCFDIEREAGVGGMGTVFRARDVRSGEPVALKVLGERSPTNAERFAREAALLARLRHPGVVRYLAHGTTPAGERWLAMEWLEGETLAERLARLGVSLPDALVLVRRAAEALAAAHALGIV